MTYIICLSHIEGLKAEKQISLFISVPHKIMKREEVRLIIMNIEAKFLLHYYKFHFAPY